MGRGKRKRKQQPQHGTAAISVLVSARPVFEVPITSGVEYVSDRPVHDAPSSGGTKFLTARRLLSVPITTDTESAPANSVSRSHSGARMNESLRRPVRGAFLTARRLPSVPITTDTESAPANSVSRSQLAARMNEPLPGPVRSVIKKRRSQKELPRVPKPPASSVPNTGNKPVSKVPDLWANIREPGSFSHRVSRGAHNRPTRTRCQTKKLVQEWECNRVMRGDGSKDRNGRVFKQGLFYGAAGYQVGPEGFHEVEFDSLELHKVSATKVKRVFVSCITTGAKQKTRPDPPTINPHGAEAKSPTHIREVYRQWCDANPGVAVYGHAVTGARPLFEELDRFLVTEEGSIFEHENEGLCLRSALINGVWRVRGREAARSLRSNLDKDIPFMKHIGQAFRALHQYRLGMDIRAARHNTYFFADFPDVRKGVYIVRIHKRGRHCVDGFDHTIVVDCGARLIIDSAERYPIRLCEESLFLCAGGHPQYSRIIQVRRICNSREK